MKYKLKDIMDGAMVVVVCSRAKLILAREGLDSAESLVASDHQYDISEAVRELDCAIDDLNSVVDRIKTHQVETD